MPLRITVKISWSTRKPLEMASFARETGNQMGTNPLFATPPWDRPAISEAADLVISTYATRMNGALAKTNFDNAVSDLDNKLHDNAEYVSEKSLGITANIESSGFVATTDVRHKSVKPSTPDASHAETLGGGNIKSTTHKVLGADDYTHIVFTDPASVITVTDKQIKLASLISGEFFVVTGNLNEVISGLKPLTQVSIVIVAHNAAGYSNMSGVTTCSVI